MRSLHCKMDPVTLIGWRPWSGWLGEATAQITRPGQPAARLHAVAPGSLGATACFWTIVSNTRLRLLGDPLHNLVDVDARTLGHGIEFVHRSEEHTSEL